LSVIILKSELAGKLIERDPERAKAEIADVEQTSRAALADVRNCDRNQFANQISCGYERKPEWQVVNPPVKDGRKAIRVVIAEDQGMVLGALAALLEIEGDIAVIGRARNGKEALNTVLAQKPDIFITDIEMPGMTRTGSCRRAKAAARGSACNHCHDFCPGRLSTPRA
jgi:PleD family two-component response regulator